MWELLQKIEKLGWKPYGKSIAELSETEKNIRLITSRSSGLWQFCCRNKLVDGKPEWIKTCGGVVREENQPHNSHYRIIESALCDEEDLEKFLLDNIKVS